MNDAELYSSEDDFSNGWNSVAAGFIQARQHSNIGRDVVAAWARELPPGGDVLDLGCGFGVPLSAALIDQGFKVHGIDASPALVEEFRNRFPLAPVQCASVETSDFFGKRFDGIIAIGLIFLLPKQSQLMLIAKAASALNKGGRFLFTAPYQVCTWKDLSTGRESTSLGRDCYLAACSENGLALMAEFSDEGENHHFSFRKC